MERLPKTNRLHSKSRAQDITQAFAWVFVPVSESSWQKGMCLCRVQTQKWGRQSPCSACCSHSCNLARDFFSPLFFLFPSFSPLSPLSLPSSFPSPLSRSSFLIFNFPFYFASERCWWHYSSRLHFRAVAESCELKVSKTVIQTLCSSSCSVWCKIRKNSWQGLHIHSILLSWWQGMCCLVKLRISSHRIQLAKKAGPCYAKSLFVNSVLPLNWF